jgi:hypothetical protein
MVLVILSASLLPGTLAAQTGADVPRAAASHPSGSMAVRNIVDLNAPRTASQEETNPPIPRFFLTGIVTIDGKKAFLKVMTEAQSGEAAKEESYMLGEGGRKGQLEVVNIDQRAGIVHVTWGGIPASLNFKDNAVTIVAVPPASPGALPMAEAIPSLIGLYSARRHLDNLPARPIRSFSRSRGRDRQNLSIDGWAQSEYNPTFPPIPPSSLTSAIEQKQEADRSGGMVPRTPFSLPTRAGPPFLPVYPPAAGFP